MGQNDLTILRILRRQLATFEYQFLAHTQLEGGTDLVVVLSPAAMFGYPVLKKWLSYREHKVLGSPGDRETNWGGGCPRRPEVSVGLGLRHPRPALVSASPPASGITLHCDIYNGIVGPLSLICLHWVMATGCVNP